VSNKYLPISKATGSTKLICGNTQRKDG
jgi:hypothetical protein